MSEKQGSIILYSLQDFAVNNRQWPQIKASNITTEFSTQSRKNQSESNWLSFFLANPF
jgi:hypothetical protein